MKRGYNGSHFRRLFFWREKRVPNCLLDRSSVKSTDTGYANYRWWTSYFCVIEFTIFTLKSRQDERTVSHRVSNKREIKTPTPRWGFITINVYMKIFEKLWLIYEKIYKCYWRFFIIWNMSLIVLVTSFGKIYLMTLNGGIYCI